MKDPELEDLKKVNALKDGFLILIGLISFLFKKI